MEQKAHAKWTGDLRSGNGTVRLGSGLLETPYTFKTRFEGAPGTNPEELLGAAHAACFTMALGALLTKAGHTPTSIESTAVVHLNKVGEGFSITGIDLHDPGHRAGLVRGRVPEAGRGRQGDLHRVPGAGGGADDGDRHLRRRLTPGQAPGGDPKPSPPAFRPHLRLANPAAGRPGG